MKHPPISPEESLLQYLHLPEQVISARFPDQTGNEDLTQDCLCAMAAAIGQFRGRSKPETYLWRVCVNTILDSLSAAERVQTHPLPQDIPAEGAEALAEAVDLPHRLETLPPGQAAILRAIQAHDYNVSAAAQSLGMSRKALLRLARQAAEQIGLTPEQSQPKTQPK